MVLLITGLAGIIMGSRLLIPCAAEAATRMGVAQDVVAATLVAFGTSLPELVTAVIAIRKGHSQIMVGNVIGADILNCLFVIGAAATASPLQITPNFFRFHFPAMLLILFSFRLLVTMNRDGWFKRVHGAWILGIYVLYMRCAVPVRFSWIIRGKRLSGAHGLLSVPAARPGKAFFVWIRSGFSSDVTGVKQRFQPKPFQHF